MTKIQRLLDRIDDINCDKESDVQELREAYSDLGEYLYKKSLDKKEYVILVENPRRRRNSGFLKSGGR